MSIQISINCRYLLWKREVPRDQWATRLEQAGMAELECRRLLSGRLEDESVTTESALKLCRALGLDDDEETLRFSDLPSESCNVLQENLKYLFGSVEHGGKRQLAERLGVDPTTVSRWLNGANEPQPATLVTLMGTFGLPADTSLRTTPIFLSLEPVSVGERRRWLHARVEALLADELRDLFPALKRLLEDR